MLRSPDTAVRYAKFALIGALVGIVFSVICVALPLAALLFLFAALEVGVSLDWVPTAPTILAMGAIGGALFATFLFIKDRFVPYVEEVQDFEEVPGLREVPDFEDGDEGPGPNDRLH